MHRPNFTAPGFLFRLFHDGGMSQRRRGMIRASAAGGRVRGARRVQASGSREATILIVDDEPGVRDVLAEYFSSQGYEAVSAESAGAAREIAAKQTIDLALVDINMPGED